MYCLPACLPACGPTAAGSHRDSIDVASRGIDPIDYNNNFNPSPNPYLVDYAPVLIARPGNGRFQVAVVDVRILWVVHENGMERFRVSPAVRRPPSEDGFNTVVHDALVPHARCIRR